MLNKGFTLVEVIVTLSIFIILIALASPITLNFYRSRSLITERDNTVGLLRRARTLAFANRNGAAHGVFFSATSTIIFEGASYVARNAQFDEIFSRDSSITATGATEVIFSALDGSATSTLGTTTISLNLGENTRAINFNSEGAIIW